MPKNFSVRLTGFKEFQEMLKRNPDKEAISNALDQGAEIVYIGAKELVPVDTGFLKSTIKKINKSKLTKIVEVSAPYAGFVEFGTSKMRAKPYVRPPLERAMKTLKQLLPKRIMQKIKVYVVKA